VNVYISPEKCKKNCNISATVCLISKESGMMMWNASLKCVADKNFNFKIQSAILKIKKIAISLVMHNGSLKHNGHPPS